MISSSASEKKRRGMAMLAGIGILVVGLVAAVCAMWLADQEANSADIAHFQRLVVQLKSFILDRIETFEHELCGARGLWPASKSVERGEYAAMHKSHDLSLEHPAVTATGFIQRVDRREANAFLETTRVDEAPDFQIKTSGNAADFYVVKFVEPQAENTAALGWDIGAEANLRAVADRAILTGEASLSPVLLQEFGKKIDEGKLLYLLPVYFKNKPIGTPEERKAALEGWVFMSLKASRMLDGVSEELGDELDFQVHQGDSSSPGSVVVFSHDVDGTFGQQTASTQLGEGQYFQGVASADVGGQHWTIDAGISPKFSYVSRTEMWTIGVGGAVLAFMAAGLTWSLMFSRNRAHKMADSKTHELQQSEQILKTIVNQIGSAVTEMEVAMGQQASGVSDQATATAEMSSTTSQLLASAKQLTKNGADVSQQAELASKECVSGTRSIHDSVQSITGIRDRVEKITEHMMGLSGKSRQISGVLDIITELSDQTNLLSLNASIEAAGAGEYGKRFAVVADEIRKLAERASASTTEIRGLIEGVQETVDSTILATEEGTKSVELGVQHMSQLEQSFERIAGQVTQTTQSAKVIEIASQQQVRVLEQVDTAIRNIDTSVKQTEASARQMQTEAQALAATAARYMTAD